MITELDPNLRFSTQTVEITFMQWGYKAVKTAKVNGNCTGMDILCSAIEIILEQLPVHSYPDCDLPYIILEHEEDGELECVDEENLSDEWLKAYVVSAVITERVPQVNEYS